MAVSRYLTRAGTLSKKSVLIGACIAVTACASGGQGARSTLEMAQRRVFEAPYDDVFSAVVEVLARDYTLALVEPETGAVETAPKADVVLSTGAFQGVYNLKVRAAVASVGADRTEVRLRVLAGQMLDFVENRWEYRDFGSTQYYQEYFSLIREAVEDRVGSR